MHDRPLGQSLKRGFFCTCPACGEGKLFRAFLKPVITCESCGQAYDGLHRADDLPAYVVIFIVGHLTVPLMLWLDAEMIWPLWVHMAIWPAFVLIFALALLQPVKGALIGMQWAKRLHGFDPYGDIHDAPMEAAAAVKVTQSGTAPV